MATATGTTASPDARQGIYAALKSPKREFSALESHTADAIRFRWRWVPGSPPGVYIDDDGRPIWHGADGDDTVDSDADAATEPSSMFESVSNASTNTSHVRSTDEEPAQVKQTESPASSGSIHAAAVRPREYGGQDRYTSLGTQRREHNIAPWYTMDLETRQYGTDVFSVGYQDTAFRLMIDTGSNTTWVRGYGLCRILTAREGGNGVYEFDIEKFTMAQMGARPLLLEHGRYFTFEDGRPVKTVNATECDGHLMYGLDDFDHALLSRCTETKEWDLASAYTWGGSPPKSYYSNPPLKFRWSDMGVAIAGSEELVLDPTYDGILGLGISRYQECFATWDVSRPRPSMHVIEDSSSFSQRLSESNMLPHAPRDRETGRRPELIMFLLIRASLRDPSYLAWQRWPFLEELDAWSPKIYLSPDNPGQRWRVLVEEIRVWVDLTAEQSSDPLGTTTRFPPSAVVDFSAWPFVLDTGAACSYFPTAQLDSLITQLGLNQAHNDMGSYYSLPQPAPGRASLEKGSLIEWTFMSQGSPVRVVTYATHFLRDKNGDGMIWPRPLGTIAQADKRSIGLLGLNFFRTVFAEFNYPSQATDEVPGPFIRLARQDGRQLSMPPLSR